MIKAHQLNDGRSLPYMGLGTVHLDDAAAASVVCSAIGAGYRLFDTASRYGNEKGVGVGIAQSGVARHSLFVTSKVRGRDQGYENTLRAADESLSRLNTDYIDLYLIHWPLPQLDLFVDTWRAMVRLREEGIVKSIGVSNFLPSHIDRLIEETAVVPAVNQIQLDPKRSRPALRDYNAANAILTEAWSPLGQARPDSCLYNPVIRSIAAKHHKTPAQVVLRWHLDMGVIPIPKTSSIDRLYENIDLFAFDLTPDNMLAIASIDTFDADTDDPDTYFEE